MKKIFAGMVVFILCTGLLNGNLKNIDEDNKNITNESEINIAKFNSKEELEEKLEEYFKLDENSSRGYFYDALEINSLSAVAESASDTASSSSNKASYSETNVQVDGVDEADIVKTNGKFIYYLTNGNLVIVKTDDSGSMNIEKTINININKNRILYCKELYINDKYIIVISNGNIEREDTETQKNDELKKYAYYNYEDTTVVKIFDINTYEEVKTFEVSGYYVSSRKIDNMMYLVSNKYLYRNYHILPICYDSTLNDNYTEIDATDIYYFKDFKDMDSCNYMLVSSIDLSNLDEKADVQTFLGAGSEVYASAESIYVSRTKTDYNRKLDLSSAITEGTLYDYDCTHTTNIHKFNIKNEKVEYVATGSVPGSLINQFSMDEYNGYFRITTTVDKYDEDSTNNLYVLDEKMNTVGKLENLAQGELIYATRFMGDKCYVVTYKTVDPLFVIDLTNPEAPQVLGELKIPGYSKYLHPLGENYLIGFGEDSVEKTYIDWDGESTTTAYSTGLKLAIFDITDFENPKELYSVKVGGRGSSSELLYNHKTLLFDEEKEIFAFPAYIYSEAGTYDNGVPEYGELEFSGAVVFNLSVEDGISLRGKITHCDKATNIWGYGDVERIIYIGDVLYTLSDQKIMASDINTIEEISEINIK